MSFATMTASGIISEPKFTERVINGMDAKIMNFNLYVKPRNKNNGYEPDENMCFNVSIWNPQQVKFYEKNQLKKGQILTIQGNFEINQFTTKEGEIIKQNRLDFASILGIGTTTEDREALREIREMKTEKNKDPKVATL